MNSMFCRLHRFRSIPTTAIGLIILSLSAIGSGNAWAGLVLNDDFSGDSGLWQTRGSVFLEDGAMVLTEGLVPPILWTQGDVAGYLHEIRFEVHLGGLIRDEGDGSGDAFRITVASGDESSLLGPETGSSTRVVLEATGDGSVTGLSTALLVPNIAKGDGWFSGIVEAGFSDPAAALSFSIADRNGLADSSLTLDSIRVSLIARGRLSNISNRGDALTGKNILITGFVMRGTESKSLLVRAMGPRLASPFGVAGFLVDPKLDLFPGGLTDSMAQNDDWQDSADAEALPQVFADLGAYPFDGDSRDSAMMVRDLEPLVQGYTVWVSGVGGATGVALAEIYAADSGVDGPTELVNISSRGPIGDGNHRPILGWVVDGNRGRKIMARAMGPTLEAPPSEGGFGLSGFVDDPILEIYRYGSETGANVLLFANDDWGLADNAAEVPLVAAAVGAFVPVPGSKDAIVLASLSPGIYTAVAKSKNGEQGLALVELYVVTGNRRPVASNNLIFVPAGVQSILPVEPLIANYIDPDNDFLVILSYGQPSQGDLTRNEEGDFVYTPPSGFIGETLFSYTVSDGEYESLPATVALQVAPAKTAIWIGGAEGDFSDTSNWKDGVVPGPEDTVWLADIDKDFTVNLDVDASIRALRVGGAGANVVFKMVSGRSLTVAEGIDVQPGSVFEWNSGTLTTTADFSIAGNLHWSGGAMNGSGETIIEAGGAALIDGTVTFHQQRRFTNKGAMVQSGNTSMTVLGEDADVVVTNAVGGTWTERSREGATMLYAYNGGGRASFVNAGTLVVESPTAIGGNWGTTVFSNNGTVEMKAGSFACNANSGQHAGDWTLGSGTSFAFNQGVHVIGKGASSSGTGRLAVAGSASVSLEAAVGMTNLLISGGSLSVDGADGRLTVSALTQTNGSLGGAKDTVITGSLSWSGGSMSGVGETIIEAGGTALIDGTVTFHQQRRFTNKGAMVQSGNTSMTVLGEDAVVVVTNAVGGTWTERSREGATMLYAYNGGGRASFVNAGTLVVESPTAIGGNWGTTALSSSGLIEVRSGVLNFTSVPVTLVSGSELKLTTGGSVCMTGSASLVLGGTLEALWAEGFVPASGAVVPLINYSSRTGSFTSVAVPPGRTVTNAGYNANQFSITLN